MLKQTFPTNIKHIDFVIVEDFATASQSTFSVLTLSMFSMSKILPHSSRWIDVNIVDDARFVSDHLSVPRLCLCLHCTNSCPISNQCIDLVTMSVSNTSSQFNMLCLDLSSSAMPQLLPLNTQRIGFVCVGNAPPNQHLGKCFVFVEMPQVLLIRNKCGEFVFADSAQTVPTSLLSALFSS